MPSEAARAGVDRVWAIGWPFSADRRLRGVRLRATDTDWSAGAGVELRGPIRILLLLLTGAHRHGAAVPVRPRRARSHSASWYRVPRRDQS